MTDVALRFGAKDVGLNAQFRKVNDHLDKLQGNARKVAGAITGSFNAVAGLAAVIGVGKLAGAALEFADSQKKLSDQTDLSVEATQRLSYISGQASVEVNNLAGGVNKLQKMLGGFEEGSEKSAEALERLGLSGARFMALDSEQQFTEVAKSIYAISDANERAVVTNEIFGKSGVELLPVLKAIGKEGDALAVQLDAIGGPVGAEAIDQVDKLGDTASTTGLAVKSLATELLATVAPPIIWGLEKIQQILGGIRVLAGGGADEVVKLDLQIASLNKSMSLELAQTGILSGGLGERMREQIRARYKPLIDELLTQQRKLLELGEHSPVVNPFGVADPLAGGSLSFEETDAEREKRLKAEEEQRLQKLQHQALVYELERAAAFEQSESLIEITQGTLDEITRRETEAVMKRLNVQTDAQAFLADVRRTFGLEEIKFEEIKNQSIFEIASGMFSALARENSKLAKVQQGIALAQTIWSTAAGIMRAFETLPWPANIVAAGKVALVGAIQVAKIKSTNYSAGSVSGSASSLSGCSSIGAARDANPQDTSEVAAAAQSSTTVYISGFITNAVVDYMAEALREGFDRDVVIIPQNSLQAEIIRGNA